MIHGRTEKLYVKFVMIETNSTYGLTPREQDIYCFFFFEAGFFFEEAGFFLEEVVVAGFLVVVVFLLLVTFLVDAFPVPVFFLVLVVVFLLAAGFLVVEVDFFLVVVVFFLEAEGLGFAAGFLGLGLAVKAFLASADSLYEALTLTRSPSVTPLVRAAFMTCFLISFCKYGRTSQLCVRRRLLLVRLFEREFKSMEVGDLVVSY